MMVESGIVLFSAAVIKQGKARKGASVFQNGAEFTIPVDGTKRQRKVRVNGPDSCDLLRPEAVRTMAPANPFIPG
jgi:hypothetical protein